MALSEVIREAVTDFAAKKIEHVVHGGPPPPDFNAHIAAALDPATVERAARAMWPDDPVTEEDVDTARAAIRAALGEQEGVK